MTDYIKPGQMGSPGEIGKPAEFASSMAEAIEDALRAILIAEGRLDFETNDNSRAARDRRMLFVAIAQGVVSHLVAHQAALEIWDGGMQTGESIEIQTQ